MNVRTSAFLSVWFFSFSSGAADPSTVYLNRDGVEKYKAEQYYEAYQLFTESIANEPYDPYLQGNLGLTFLKNEEKDKALGAFKSALQLAERSQDPEALYASHLNLGTYLATSGDVDQALVHFQKALEQRPQDPLVRENIEKMWQSQQGQGQGGEQNDQQQSQNKDQQNQGGQGENKEKPEDPSEGEKPDQKQNKPKPFDSQELTQDDVRKILDELKNQEQKIRANVYEGQGKDKPRDKDW